MSFVNIKNKIKNKIPARGECYLAARRALKEVIESRIHYRINAHLEQMKAMIFPDRRGLEGQFLTLIAMDGGKGLKAALLLVYGDVPIQHCCAHRTRMVLN